MLHQLLSDRHHDPVLITHADSEQPKLFAVLREMRRLGHLPAYPVHMFDGLHTSRESSIRYNRQRLAQLAAWLVDIGGHRVTENAFAAEAALQRDIALAIEQHTGVLRAAATGAAFALMPADLLDLLAEAKCTAPQSRASAGERVFLAGSAQPATTAARTLEERGLELVGDDQDWGDPLLAAWRAMPENLEAYGNKFGPVPRFMVPARDRASALLTRMNAAGATLLVYDCASDDEAARWDINYMARACGERGIAFEPLVAPLPGQANATPTAMKSSSPVRPAGGRSKKTLRSLEGFGQYQREWFGALRSEADRPGRCFAVVNANAPQEVLRAMEIPFVVNQWWASIVAAKQQSSRYLDLLSASGFPRDAEAYSAQGLAAHFDESCQQAPWGGLPKPNLLQAVMSTPSTPRIFDHWAQSTGAAAFLYEQSIDTRTQIPVEWWDLMPDHWDQAIEAERLDLMQSEITALIGAIEASSEHRFNAEKFREVMDLVNAQEEHYRRARDLIAAARHAPISIADSMPATMVPQWHRGTEWGRDAARRFADEVAQLIDAGYAVCPGERLRLMWVGRGLWSDPGFYQRWEASHGAVFVWSMYLALAADGYIRYFDRGRDPLRALAARFVTMGDELRLPGWAGPWHVREARTHRVDAAIALADSDPFVISALEAAGIPVLALDLDNYHLSGDNGPSVEARITEFLDQIAR